MNININIEIEIKIKIKIEIKIKSKININMNNHTKFDSGIVAFDIKNNGMLVGTKGGEIYEFKSNKPNLLL